MLERICKANRLMDKACHTLGRQIKIMEVCGTHTVSMFRSGIRATLPLQLKLLSGPGCPVCVTGQGYIDLVLELAERKDCIIATYGDMIRVPGSTGSLETKNKNNNVKVVLSAVDALEMAKENPAKTVVFVAVGFETTTPATAVVVKEAAEAGIENFCVLCAHKVVLPAMDALLSNKNDKIDAFLCPGHVSVIIGSQAYSPIVEKYNKPCVVAGFEPMQIIEGIAEICRQLDEGKAEVKSIYDAAVRADGNKTAQRIIEECFEPMDGWWRGIGNIPQSALKLKNRYSKFDAFERFGLVEKNSENANGCQCGQVLCGLMEPFDCGLFGKGCTPQTPVGPCMVSSEGACAAWFKYGRKRR